MKDYSKNSFSESEVKPCDICSNDRCAMMQKCLNKNKTGKRCIRLISISGVIVTWCVTRVHHIFNYSVIGAFHLRCMSMIVNQGSRMTSVLVRRPKTLVIRQLLLTIIDTPNNWNKGCFMHGLQIKHQHPNINALSMTWKSCKTYFMIHPFHGFTIMQKSVQKAWRLW